MIHETLTELKVMDERIRQLESQIETAQGIRGGMALGIRSSGIGRPTESCAIQVADLKEELAETLQEREKLFEKLKRERSECRNETLWELILDHFYYGYSWKETAARHKMKESAVKMCYSRFNKKLKAATPSVIMA